MSTKLTLAVFVTLVAVSLGCETWPNSTDTALHWFNCPDSGNIVFHTLAAVDANNNPEYPVKLKEPLYINVNLDNNGAVYSEISLDISLYQWGGWQGCSWHEVPTFGLLANQDACKNGVPCPINAGKNQNLKITMDFSGYDSIISLLKNDAPYQLMYKLTDKTTSQTSCTIVQARTYTNQ
uniref:ML domain-containing protein n=1 Tax=Parastrongyloides trichosuri TaxID=131310 RepID=A0A0N4ZBR9_PARTI